MPEARHSLTTADVARIESLELAHARHVLEGDFDALEAMYARDVLVMPANRADVRGWLALRALLAELPRVSAYDVSIEEIGGCGDFAWARGRYSLALADGAFDDTGRWLHILRRSASGSWLVTQDIFSSDREVR